MKYLLPISFALSLCTIAIACENQAQAPNALSSNKEIVHGTVIAVDCQEDRFVQMQAEDETQKLAYLRSKLSCLQLSEGDTVIIYGTKRGDVFENAAVAKVGQRTKKVTSYVSVNIAATTPDASPAADSIKKNLM